MNNIGEKITAIRQKLPAGVDLVAVSKFHPASAILEAYNAGQRIFGESRAQELKQKCAELPADIEWHFIGHLQSNKVRAIMPHVALFQSVDTVNLLQCINTEAERIGKTAYILIQLHVAMEETKFGFSPEELPALLQLLKGNTLPHIRLRGVMGMASNTDNTERIAADFKSIYGAYEYLKENLGAPDDFNIVSMGMSHDAEIAISCGSNMVRIGTDIFGEREY